MALYAFDGTWNSEKDAGRYDMNTNVVRFKDLYTGTKFFYKGVGTRHGTLGKIAGGAFGVGGHDRIEDAKRDMAKQFVNGDRAIDIIGFSRGAALAVHFANVVGDDGVKVNGVVEKPLIRFLGVWDVVAAFGVPINLPGFNFNRMNLGYKLGLAKAVQSCYHADVGGGNNNHALNDITLRWMLRKAMATGLPMAPDCVTTGCARADITGKIGENFDPIHNRAREPKEGDRYHYTVAGRPKHVNPPDPCTRETEVNETQMWKDA
jgi:uncharacterized protein (DUF2235 family)